MDQVGKLLLQYWPVIAVVVGLLVARFVLRKQDAAYAKLALTLVRRTLGDKLGPKADIVLSVWLEALDQAANDGLSGQEMVEAIVSGVKQSVFSKEKVMLNEVEEAAVREATEFSVQALSVKTQPTKDAVKALSLGK